MSVYQKFLIGDADCFDPVNFPGLEKNLEQVVKAMATQPSGPGSEMLLSFARDHCISMQLVKDHPGLSTLVSSGTLPLEMLEDLLESSRQNPAFRKGLEAYTRNYLDQRTSRQVTF